MTPLLDHPSTNAGTDAAHRMRTTMTAARLSFTWFGVRKSLTREQKEQAADSFGAEGEFLSAGKKLIDTQHPKFRAVTAVRSRAVNYWKGLSLPYPEVGIRLIKQNAIDEFVRHMTELREELEEAVVQLDEHYEELTLAARRRLGSLYSVVDNLRDFFERFRSLNVGTNAELDRLVDQAQQIVSGVRPRVCGTTPDCDNRSLPNCQGFSRCSTGCWFHGRDAGVRNRRV